MDLFEYEAKELFAKYDVNVLPAKVCSTPEEVFKAAEEFDSTVVVKAQVKIGGRGKAGGVKLAKTPQEAELVAQQILGMDIKGHKVEKVMVAVAANIEAEYYFSMMVDRSQGKHVAIISADGGMDIETLAKQAPEKIVKYHFVNHLQEKDYDAMCNTLFTEEIAQKIKPTLEKLYQCYKGEDATLVEVNPLILDDKGQIVALDAKVSLDDNARGRQAQHEEFVHISAEDPRELKAKQLGLNYVRLNGEVGIIGNGAGLVMSTLDVVDAAGQQYGVKPANFLDIGGGADAETMVNALKLVMTDEQVKSVFINVFGGITACDLVAEGIIEALNTYDGEIKPIVIRLDGNAAQTGLKLLQEYKNSKITVVKTMDEAAAKAAELAYGGAK